MGVLGSPPQQGPPPINWGPSRKLGTPQKSLGVVPALELGGVKGVLGSPNPKKASRMDSGKVLEWGEGETPPPKITPKLPPITPHPLLKMGTPKL